MILGVDLDGVCGDYTRAFRQSVSLAKGIVPWKLTLDVSWDYTEWGINSREEFLALHSDAVAGGLFRNMPAMEGASEALWHLSDNDVWNRIITHRLGSMKGSQARVARDTVDWLDEKDIPYRDLCFVGDKPQVGADVYLDDAPTHIGDLQAQGKEVIIFDQPYNRHIEGFRARNCAEVVEILGY